MAAVGRSWVMETRGDYQADASADDTTADATPEKVVPMRRSGFTMFDNAYLDEAMADLSGAAWKCLSFLIRQTCGFQAQHAALSLSIFSDGIRRADGTLSTKGTGLTRPSVIAALDDLLRANIIQRTDDGKRTSIPSYALRRQEDWNISALHGTRRRTSKKTLLADGNGKKTLPIQPETSKETCLEEPSSLSSNFTHVNKEEKKESPEKENDSDANASADAPKSSAPKSKPKKERRPPTPDEEYRVALIKAVEDVRDGEQAPNHGQEWRAAGDFYRMQAPLETVIACYREEMRRPTWDTRYLSLMTLKSNYGAFVRSGAANYRAGIERARAAVAGKYDKPRQNGRAAATSLPSTIRQLSD